MVAPYCVVTNVLHLTPVLQVGNVVGQLTSSVVSNTVNSVVGQLVNAFDGKN